MANENRIAVIYKDIAGKVTHLVIMDGNVPLVNISIKDSTEEALRRVATDFYKAARIHVAQEIDNGPLRGNENNVE